MWLPFPIVSIVLCNFIFFSGIISVWNFSLNVSCKEDLTSFSFYICLKSLHFVFIFERCFPCFSDSRLVFWEDALKALLHCPLTCIVSNQESAVNLKFCFLNIICVYLFFFLCFYDFSHYLWFWFVMMCLGVVFFMVLMLGFHWASWVCGFVVFIKWVLFLAKISNNFLYSLLSGTLVLYVLSRRKFHSFLIICSLLIICYFLHVAFLQYLRFHHLFICCPFCCESYLVYFSFQILSFSSLNTWFSFFFNLSCLCLPFWTWTNQLI